MNNKKTAEPAKLEKSVCDRLIPGYPCPVKESCRENGCSAKERKTFWDACDTLDSAEE